MVTMPEPISMLTDFCAWASRQPERAVRLLEAHRPTSVVKAGFTEEARSISILSPVARMARPSRVRRNSVSSTSASTTASSATTVL